MPRKPAGSAFSVEWRGVMLTGFAVLYPGRPGVYSGPPEKCYPDEPAEVEITELLCNDFDAMPLMEIEQAAEEITALVEKVITPEEPEGPEFEPDDGMTDVEADADTLKSAGMGTDEDYGYYGD